MASTEKKNKAKPTRLTEFFHPSQEIDKPGLNPPPSPDRASISDSLDQDISDISTSLPPAEGSMHSMLQLFRQQLQADFKTMISELKTDIQAIISRTEHVEKKMSDFAKSHNSLIDANAALEEEVTQLSASI